MCGMKLGVLQSKWKRYTHYLKQMTILAEDACFWEQEWRTMFENLCMFLSSDHATSAKSALQKVLGTTLNDTSKATVAWTTAVADFDKYGKHHRVAERLREVDIHWRSITKTLELSNGNRNLIQMTKHPSRMRVTAW